MRTVEMQANDWLQNKDIISSKEMIKYPDWSRLDEIPDWSRRKKELSDLLRAGTPVEEVLTKAKEYRFKEPFLSRLIKKYWNEKNSGLFYCIYDRVYRYIFWIYHSRCGISERSIWSSRICYCWFHINGSNTIAKFNLRNGERMAKKLILFSLLILSFVQVSKGQRVRFYGGMEYYPQNSAKIRQDLQIGGRLYDILLSYRGGNYSLEIGAEYNPYNQIYVYSSVYTEMDAISPLKWAPVNGRYTIGAKYKFKIFEFGIDHSCYHPIRVYEYKETDPQMYGGYTKFSVKFSTK